VNYLDIELNFEQLLNSICTLMRPFINIHTHTTRSNDNLIQITNFDLNRLCPINGFYSYGIHPWQVDSVEFQVETSLRLLEERLKSPQAIALGEVGLDKLHKASFEKQIELFECQIELSEALQKPMILHDVRSHNEILALRKKHKAIQPWILHGFSGTEQDIKQFIGQGMYFSVGESLLHPERKISKSFKFIDLNCLFLETDMSEIGIEKVYEAAAKLLEMDINALREQIFSNFARIFE
jgi:TatD DNase family protein